MIFGVSDLFSRVVHIDDRSREVTDTDTVSRVSLRRKPGDLGLLRYHEDTTGN